MAIRYISRNKAQLIVDYYIGSKRHRKTRIVSITGKKDAQEQLLRFEAECGNFSTDITVENLLIAYISHLKSMGVRDTTIRGYEICVKRIVKSFGNASAKSVTPLQIEKYIAENDNYSPKTIKNTISFLSSAYKYAINKDELDKNPCDKVSLPKQNKKEIKVLAEEDIPRFMKALDNETMDLKVLCELALFCGLRLSELLAITYEDINFDFKTIRIDKSRHKVKGGTVIQPPKTERSNRIVAVPDFIIEDIKNLEHITDCEYLIQYCGEPMRHDYAVRRMSIIRKRYDFDITIHGLRHTFASMLHKSGDFDLAEISAALGHANLSTTLNIYTHVMGGALNSQKRIANHFECKNGAKMAHLEKVSK